MAMERPWLLLGALGGFLAVAGGAIGAHGAGGGMSPVMQSWIETASRYAFAHSLALLLVGILARQDRGRRSLDVAGIGFAAGLVLFCGSLALLAVLGWRPLAWVTPLGGLAFLLGWASLALYAWRGRARQPSL
jgi:uncharacterized membrane protein YgdD (TMEM256/DUF423 family)